MTKIIIEDLPLANLKRITRQPLTDSRGSLTRLYCHATFSGIGLEDSIVHINHTLTHKTGTVRGMHFQKSPFTEDKIVMCLRGRIFDVAIDLRKNSATFLKWHGEILDAKNQHGLLIPKGFAHGFQTLTPDCEVLYFHTAAYQPDYESGVSPLDPLFNIAWPLPITEMSERDKNHALINLAESFSGIFYAM